MIDIPFVMQLAYIHAKKSPDPSIQNGAVLIDKYGYVIGEGYNDFPPGVEYTPEQLLDREWKLRNIEHAERNAIYEAVRLHNDLHDSTLVCPFAACTDCARAIVLTGVKKVIMHKARMDMTPERWKVSVDQGFKIMRDAQVVLEFYDAPIGDCEPILVCGNLWQP